MVCCFSVPVVQPILELNVIAFNALNNILRKKNRTKEKLFDPIKSVRFIQLIESF